VIPYENSGRTSYAAVRHFLAALGPAEVSIIGSSRTREAFVMPQLRAALERALGRPVAAANYASQRVAADEAEQFVRLILRREPRPHVLLYGVSPLQLAASELEVTHAEELWMLEDWLRHGRAEGYDLDLLPDVTRNEVGAAYRTFGYRRTVPLRIGEWLNGREAPPNPILGEVTVRQRRVPERSLVTRPVSPQRVRDYLEKRMVDGEYALSEEQWEHVRALVRLCREAGVEPVLVEVPLPPILTDAMPAGTLDRYGRMMDGLVEETRVTLVRVRDLDIEFGDLDFREQSHLSLRGAERFTAAFVERFLGPHLAAAESD
jgi:hypothetical protein